MASLALLLATMAPLQPGLATAPNTAVPPPWADASVGPLQRAQKLVAAMTLDEKITMVHGNQPWTNLRRAPAAEYAARDPIAHHERRPVRVPLRGVLRKPV